MRRRKQPIAPEHFFVALQLHVLRADVARVPSGARVCWNKLTTTPAFARAMRAVRKAIREADDGGANADMLVVRYEITQERFGPPTGGLEEWTYDEGGDLIAHRAAKDRGKFLRGREPADCRFRLGQTVMVGSLADDSANLGVVVSRPPTIEEVRQRPRVYRGCDDQYIVDFPDAPGAEARKGVVPHDHVHEEGMIEVTWPIAEELKERLTRAAARAER